MAMVRKTLLHRATFAVSILGHGRLFLPCASFSAVPSPVSFAASLVHHRSNEVVLVGNGHSCSSSTLMLVRRSNNISNDSYATTITNKNASFRSCSRLFSSSVDRGPTVSYTYDSDDDDEGDFDDDIKHGDNDDDDDDNIDEPESSDTATPTITKRSHLLYQALFQSLESSLTNLSKKTTSLQRELEKAQSLEETTKRANLIVSNLYRLPPGTKSALVEDWENDGQVVELVLNTKEYGSAQEESDALFALARKVKRGSKVVEGLMKDSLEGETILKEALLDLVSMAGKTMEDLALDGANKIHVEITDIVNDDMHLDEGTLVLIQERLERSSKKTGFKGPNLDAIINSNNKPTTKQKSTKSQGNKLDKSSRNNKAIRYEPNPRELISPSGLKVLVGRNRRDNEAICFQLSRPTDVWMHSRGCPGAHVLLCVRRGAPAAMDEDFQFAADLAVFYSDARTERKAEVTTAEPKHITKPRGAPPGAVTLRQEGKTLVGRPENVSEDLKEAREMSGGAWDEMGYRKLGTRAKNKKRTAAVEKESRQKKRKEALEKNKRRKRKQDDDSMGSFD